MLLDSTHKRWCLATILLGLLAVGLYLWLDARTPGGLSGGDLAGLGFGLAGSTLMLYAGALSLLRRVPSWWWIGSRKTWLRGHIWLGLLSGVLILCHSGFRWGGLLEKVLMVVLFLTLATGVVGLVLQQVIPALLTAQVKAEAPYDQIPQLCTAMRQDADDQVAAARADKNLPPGVTDRLDEFFRKEVRPFLAERYDRSAALADPTRLEGIFARLRAHARIRLGGEANWPVFRPVARNVGNWESRSGCIVYCMAGCSCTYLSPYSCWCLGSLMR